MSNAYRALFEPMTIGGLTLKNRIMSTSHSPAYVENGFPKTRYQLYHEEKAKGGLALSMFGGSSTVSVDSPPSFGQIDVSTDGVIEPLQRFSERMHAHDCALMIQLTHMGRRTSDRLGDWLPTIAPSRVREPAHRAFPKSMDQYDIHRVVRDFGEATRRAKIGDLDGCELSILGHLAGQFWSPAVNKRTDGYGGSIANRARFSMEVLEAMRAATGGGFLIGMRFSLDEGMEDGLKRDECLEILRLHVEAGLVDFLNVTTGNSYSHLGLSGTVPNMAHPSAPQVEAAGVVRRAFGLPVFHACRVQELATADWAVREGHVDMIGMTRAHMADPYLVAKARRGEEDRIRPCVGAGYCIDRIYEGGDGALCLHNPATGREALIPQVISPSSGVKRKVVVIGAGPAGLEAARVCALRGHEVVLFEAASEPGGQVLLAARATWRKDLAGIVDWLVHEVDVLGVELRTNCYAEPNQVTAQHPDVVVVATGGLPNVECVEGAEHVASTWEILGGQVAPGESVLLFDDHGDHHGPACAEFIVAKGAKVEIVTPDRAVGWELGSTNFSVHLANLYRAGVKLTADTRLTQVIPKGNQLEAVMVNEYSGEQSVRRIDQVVVEHGTLPDESLYEQLVPGSINQGQIDLNAMAQARAQNFGHEAEDEDGYVLFRVGDAVTSRNIHAAIYDSLRLCKDL